MAHWRHNGNKKPAQAATRHNNLSIFHNSLNSAEILLTGVVYCCKLLSVAIGEKRHKTIAKPYTGKPVNRFDSYTLRHYSLRHCMSRGMTRTGAGTCETNFDSYTLPPLYVRRIYSARLDFRQN